MTARTGVRQVKKVLRNADDIVHLLTGKRLKSILGRGINIFGEELAKKASKLFIKHGALEYRECVGDDLNAPFALPFPKLMKLKPSLKKYIQQQCQT